VWLGLCSSLSAPSPKSHAQAVIEPSSVDASVNSTVEPPTGDGGA
jgi:hypothetical protein